MYACLSAYFTHLSLNTTRLIAKGSPGIYLILDASISISWVSILINRQQYFVYTSSFCQYLISLLAIFHLGESFYKSELLEILEDLLIKATDFVNRIRSTDCVYPFWKQLTCVHVSLK